MFGPFDISYWECLQKVEFSKNDKVYYPKEFGVCTQDCG